MRKENWILHIENTENLTRPSEGGSIELWKNAILKHKKDNCVICKERQKTKKANENRKQKEQILKDIGLIKVYGPISGKVYWE
jgi:hypothetical protein